MPPSGIVFCVERGGSKIRVAEPGLHVATVGTRVQ
jgi:hypothetical protein